MSNGQGNLTGNFVAGVLMKNFTAIRIACHYYNTSNYLKVFNTAFNMINFNTNDKLSVNHPLYSPSTEEERTHEVSIQSNDDYPEPSHKNATGASGMYRGQLITSSPKDSIYSLLYDSQENLTGSNGQSFQDHPLHHIL